MTGRRTKAPTVAQPTLVPEPEPPEAMFSIAEIGTAITFLEVPEPLHSRILKLLRLLAKYKAAPTPGNGEEVVGIITR